MLSETDASEDRSVQPRRSHWPIGLALLGLVIAVLGTAVILDQQLRPRVGIEPLPVARGEQTSALVPEAVLQPKATQPASAVGPTASYRPTVAPPEEEVEEAYRRYWDLYTEALYTLDTSRMGQVAVGDELRRIQEEVDGFRAQERAVRADVSHSYLIGDLTDNEATVYDEIADRSYLIDPATKEPSRGPGTVHTVKDIFYLRKVDGAWKVTKHLRQEG
jgi:hypothetical protein